MSEIQMTMNGDVERLDSIHYNRQCTCGAKFLVYEDDGEPGCRDIETVSCPFCGREIARHFGTCEGRVVDDSKVPDELKAIKCKYDTLINEYVKKNGCKWGMDEYDNLITNRKKEINAIIQKSEY